MRGARNEQVRGDVGAIFSPCGQYRYLLWRRWGDGPKMLWIMLNPSTANETDNDPTVERCQRRAVAMGYGAVYVANIFALRSTDPKALRQVDDPVGPDNDEAIQLQANQAEIVVCGWGNHGTLNGRGQRVMQMIREIGVEPHALRVTGAGQPGHPLYVSYGIRPSPLHELQTSR